jgi:hypothetical protein
MYAPDWYLEMPVISQLPTVVLSVAMLWFCVQLFRIAAAEARRQRREEVRRKREAQRLR